MQLSGKVLTSTNEVSGLISAFIHNNSSKEHLKDLTETRAH